MGVIKDVKMAVAACSAGGKKIHELRVADLKLELEKRGIEKSGVKAALLDKLKKALEEEGHDPDEFVFDVNSSRTESAGSTPVKSVGASDAAEADGDFEEMTQESAVDEAEEEAMEEARAGRGSFEEMDDSVNEEAVLLTEEEETNLMNEEEKILSGSTEADNKGAACNGGTSKENDVSANPNKKLSEATCDLDKPPLTPGSAPTATEFTSEDVGMIGSTERKDDDLS